MPEIGFPAEDTCAYRLCHGKVNTNSAFPYCHTCHKPLARCDEDDCKRFNRRWAHYCRSCGCQIENRLEEAPLDLAAQPSLKWEEQSPIQVDSNKLDLFAHQGVFVYPISDSVTYVRNAATGELVRRLNTDEPWSTYATHDSQSIVLGLGRRLVRLNRDSFECEDTEWGLSDSNMILYGTPVLIGDCTYVIARSGQHRRHFFRLQHGSDESLGHSDDELLGPIELDGRVIVFSRAKTWVVEQDGRVEEVPSPGNGFAPDGGRARWVRHRNSIIVSAGMGNLRRFLVDSREFQQVEGENPGGMARLDRHGSTLMTFGNQGIHATDLDQAGASTHSVIKEPCADPPCVFHNWVFAYSVRGVMYGIMLGRDRFVPPEIYWEMHAPEGEHPLGKPVYCDHMLAVYYQVGKTLKLRVVKLSNK